MLLDVYLGPYGLYRQEIEDTHSELHRFRPEIVCFALDATHLAGDEKSIAADQLNNLVFCWEEAQRAFQCSIIQQTAMPRLPLIMGNHEDRLGHSPANTIQEVNRGLRERAAGHGVALLSVDTWAAESGIAAWFDPALWYAAKQEVHPRASLMYGDQVGRLVAALRGRSAKCLVLDLDNTLWGGVIGDDGMSGIVVGQGSPGGEAFVAFQRYARQLARRGVLLGVCSKNDHAVAMEAFETHPEMVLKPEDISCFVANWQDKAANLRHIAESLNIGLDALVFVDDNPAERRLIREELPMVAVPEMPEDPAEYVGCLAAAGYFEALELTAEDHRRTELYRANASRQALRQTATDMGSYLRGLDMKLVWSSFDDLGFRRIVQLINKTNQFNLTTRRYTDAEVEAVMRDEQALTLQLRLTDVHGDNGVIGVVVGFRNSEGDLVLDTWLMSCRVLGRGVEDATLNLIAARAKELGCTRIVGIYRPSAKNGMVRDHYRRLDFDLLEELDDGSSRWVLPLHRFMERATHLRVEEGDTCKTTLCMAS